MTRPSPAIVVAVLALIAAVAGTAVAGPDATTSALTKSNVKKIAAKQVNALAPAIADEQITRRAPGLSVARGGERRYGGERRGAAGQAGERLRLVAERALPRGRHTR
jgi:hypothetical protein